MENQWLRFHCPAFTCLVKVEKCEEEWVVTDGPNVVQRWKGLDIQDMLGWAKGKWGEAKVVEATGL